MRQKVDIRSIRHAQLLHGKMYHITNAGVEEAILGSSNFTVRGLGLGAGKQASLLHLRHFRRDLVERPLHRLHTAGREVGDVGFGGGALDFQV